VPAAANYVAGWVGIDEVIAQARPERKLEIVRELQTQGARVGMIGDGINDAPALAAADVGFAIGSGTDIAMETADMTLVQGDITKVAEAMSLSRDTLRIIHQNLFWAFAYNTVAIPVAALGKLKPMIASAAMGVQFGLGGAEFIAPATALSPGMLTTLVRENVYTGFDLSCAGA